MDTQKVNQTQPTNKKKEGKSNFGTNVFTGAAAAAMGGVAGAMANEYMQQEPTDETLSDAGEVPAEEPVNSGSEEQEVQEEVITATPVEEEAPTVEAEPIVASELPEEPHPFTASAEDAINAGEAIDHPLPTGALEPAIAADDTIDVDDLTTAIISGVEEDPADIDMAEVINFDEIGTVYTVTGESYTAAAFHDNQGNELVMVDVDGDEVFDVITTTEGNIVSETAGNLTMGDAEMMINDAPVYLAQTDPDVQEGTSSLGEDFMNDIINA